MGFTLNQAMQVALNDKYNNLTIREKKMLEDGWASAFADMIFPLIREERFAGLYSSNAASRPNTPINVIIGALILKELLGMSDDDMVTGIMFDVRLQYALHTTSFGEQPLSDRTFSRFRERLYIYERETGIDLMKEEMLYLADKIAEFMKLKPYMKRMDSMMIASACKDMTRLEVVYVTTANLAKAIYRVCGCELLAGMESYLNTEDKNRVIYHNKGEDRNIKIQSIIEDCARMIDRLGEAGEELSEYVLAKRMLEDQSISVAFGNRRAKDSRDIKPDSLQNPSDPDATYRKKAGEDYIGYVANVVETFDDNGASVITDYSFEQNRYSDSKFCEETILNISKKGEATTEEKVTLIGDGAFDSAANSNLAKDSNINLVTTAMTGPKPPEVFADFEIDNEAKQVVRCPAGHEPIRQGCNQVTDTYRVVMEKGHCANCPNKEVCNAKMQAKSAVVNICANKVERAKTVKANEISSEEYAGFRNARNAIEGIPSVMRRKYDVDDMPVFGWMKAKLFFGFKVGAYNFKKLVKFIKGKVALLPPNSCPQVQYAQI